MFRFSLIFLSVIFFSFQAGAQFQVKSQPGEIKNGISRLNVLGCVMYVAAHPDDENSRLLSYLANEKKFRTVYLSMTRGDGGQNLIGKEQGSALGLIRTQELIEARRVDGAEQYFTRANDFGFSKNPDETLRFWNHDEALSDVVFAIRKFKPDVIINRFPTTGEGGHGHHTASAMLAIEAFHAAADPLRFPEQLKYVETWQPKRVFHNSFVPRGQPTPDYEGQLQLDVGGYNPLLGVSYGELAAASRSKHKSQGFGVAASRGTTLEYFRKIDGDTAVTGIFDNINTGWSRIGNYRELEQLIAKTGETFDVLHPENSLDKLIAIHRIIRTLPDGYWKEVKLKEVKNLVAACAGLWMEPNAAEGSVVPNDTLTIAVSVIARQAEGIVLNKIILPGWDSVLNSGLNRNEVLKFLHTIRIPGNARFSNPYWLQSSYTAGRYEVTDQQMRGTPWNEPSLNASFTFSIKGESFTFLVPVIHKWADPVIGEQQKNPDIIPPVSIVPAEKLMVFNSVECQKISVRIDLSGNSAEGELRAFAPPGYRADPASHPVNIHKPNIHQYFDFTLTPLNNKTGDGNLKFEFVSENKNYTSQVNSINYNHISPITYFSPAQVRVIMPSVKTKISKIGYIPGAGDEVASCLRLAGFDVHELAEENVLYDSLSQYDAIVTGIRAYNTIENIDLYYKPLMNYIRGGGNLIVQYNTNNFISNIFSDIGPYPFKITRDRVTVEEAPVTFIDPADPILQSPNKITTDDFNGWIQERGLYFANELSPEYKSLFSMNDPGEKPLTGSTIVARHGKGFFIYTGLSFFRQLPAGVPGAYKLFVNFLNAGK